MSNKIGFLILPLIFLNACAVGPTYERPMVETPIAFKEVNGWKASEPSDARLRGKWWEIYNDSVLNSLEEQVNISNQNLLQAEAQYRQARALVQSVRAGYFPTIGANASVSRSSSGGNSGTSANSTSRGINTNRSVSIDANWEADVWGRIQRTVESNEASAQASAADLASARLSAQTELALNYFQLRTLDSQKKLLDQTVAAFEKSLQLTKNRYAAGIAAQADVVQAETQLKTTMAQAINVGLNRAQLEHAIALLIGKPPAELYLPSSPLAAVPPAIPIGSPSTLLERRPDIAAAERRVAAANAEIGVVKSAYFPQLTLSATGGFQSASAANWLTLPNRFWSVGPALAMTLFDAGRRRAVTDQAIAAYDATVAAYRQTVLTGFKEVEDNVAALRILEEEARVQDEALQAARRSVELTTNQYKAGTVSYLNVITAQATALNNERTAVDIDGQRLGASVSLIKAFGGGWTNTSD